MWQRIQTVWLLLAGITTTLMLFMPMALFGGVGKLHEAFMLIDLENGQTLHWFWELFSLDALCTVLSFAIIFLYKNRKLQMRLCLLNMLLLLGMLAWSFWQVVSWAKELGTEHAFKLPFFLPILAIIFLYLAFRGVRKDEILVRLSNRIR